VLTFPNVFEFFPHELSGLRTGRFPFAFIFAGPLKGFFSLA
jgi:hypothetical protein